MRHSVARWGVRHLFVPFQGRKPSLAVFVRRDAATRILAASRLCWLLGAMDLRADEDGLPAATHGRRIRDSWTMRQPLQNLIVLFSPLQPLCSGRLGAGTPKEQNQRRLD